MLDNFISYITELRLQEFIKYKKSAYLLITRPIDCFIVNDSVNC